MPGKGLNIPAGAKISWSSATLFRAGPSALASVTGKTLAKNWNHFSCMGAIIIPYPIKRANRSKSNWGGRAFESGISSRF
jgi:hypothetical protein